MGEPKTITCRCEFCNQKLQIPLETDLDRESVANDVFMCGFCGKVSKFDKDMKLIDATPEDINTLKLHNYHGWEYLRQDAYMVDQRAKLN